jgi:hypothetical protein
MAERRLSRADQIRSQQQRQRGWKLYSFHAPEVECIGKGKASAPFRARHVDKGYRGHDAPNSRRVFISDQKRGPTAAGFAPGSACAVTASGAGYFAAVVRMAPIAARTPSSAVSPGRLSCKRLGAVRMASSRGVAPALASWSAT